MVIGAAVSATISKIAVKRTPKLGFGVKPLDPTFS
jgi:hypothetical protein